MTEPLPYHCPTLNGNYLRPPGEGQIAAAKEKRAKFPHMLLGFLEKCLECGGKALVKREGAVIPLEGQIIEDLQEADSEAVPLIEEKSGKSAHGISLDESEGRDMRYDSIDFGEGEKDEGGHTGPPLQVVPECPRHPGEPQVACGPGSKRAGQYLGACQVCMQERAANKRPRRSKGQMTPAVARDLGVKPVPPAKPSVCQNPPAEPGIDVQPGPVVSALMSKVADKIPTCPRPDCEAPGSPVKIDKLGRSMGMCQACVSARGRRGGFSAQSGKLSASVEVMLNEAKYADLKAWLEAQADENERTLLQEIMYRLKLSMRQTKIQHFEKP